MQYGLELRALLRREQRAFTRPQRVLERRQRARRVLSAGSIHYGEGKLPVADTAIDSSSWGSPTDEGCCMGDDESSVWSWSWFKLEVE